MIKNKNETLKILSHKKNIINLSRIYRKGETPFNKNKTLVNLFILFLILIISILIFSILKINITKIKDILLDQRERNILILYNLI